MRSDSNENPLVFQICGYYWSFPRYLLVEKREQSKKDVTLALCWLLTLQSSSTPTPSPSDLTTWSFTETQMEDKLSG